MNIVSAESLLVQMALWVVGAIALAVAGTYFLRSKVRERYPGGKRRYLAALTVQAAGFMVPIPFVLIFLIGAPIPAMFDVFIAVMAGIIVVTGLRYLPLTGPLLRDLARTRLELALERMGTRS
ncbi:MAG: hypothetical protein KF779_05630 [Hyphomonadaceae bacterium]|nr:hypothetical protein [Hyphomonadaceae bacterium]